MNDFRIMPELSWYTDPRTEIRMQGHFLDKSVEAFYNSDYRSGNAELRDTVGTTENIICTLKNTFNEKSLEELKRAFDSLIEILKIDLPLIHQSVGKENLTICVVPRAKAQDSYAPFQMLFKEAVKTAIGDLNGYSDGTDYMIRHTDTKTTHLINAGYGGAGDSPYPGITINTCTISPEVKGKDILLIDDLYTKGVNIDEDAIQALLDEGANSVLFYSLGKTYKML